MIDLIFKQKKYSNELVKLIETNPNVELETVLLHNDLMTSIRNESEVLYDRILLEDNKPWFLALIDYAFFDKKPPKKFQKFNSINQINKNASFFFGNCGQRFILYFKKDSQNPNLIKPTKMRTILNNTISKFISDDNEYYLNPMYAGHFQRFLENFLRNKALEQQEIIEILYPFLIKNVKILAYQQLITQILSDYTGVINDYVIYDILSQMLQRSCIAVNYINRQKTQKRPENAILMSKKLNKKQKINEKNQPLNIDKNPIPSINIIFEKDDDTKDLNEVSQKVVSIPWKKKERNKIEYKNKEDAEIETYLLLMSIRTSLFDQGEIIRLFREDDDKYPLIQALFYCGTRCEVTSLISLESFRLLSIIFNGSKSLSIEKWKFLEEEKSQLDFYNRFADEMIFDPTCLTYKMIHSLPVFWNHRYNKDTYKKSDEEKVEIDTEDYYKDGKKHVRKREKGETALEILQPCLLCEPPISSQLTFFCTDILIQISSMRKELYLNDNEETRNKKNVDLMVKLDGFILDFYLHHFSFGNEFKIIFLFR